MSSPNHSTPAHPDTGYGHEEKQGRGWLRSKIKINYSSKKRDSVHAPADDDSLPKPKTSKLKKPFKTLRRKEGSKQTIDFSSVSQSDSQASGGDDASQSASSGSSEQLGIPPDPAATEPLSWTEIAPESLTRGMKDKDVKRQEMIYELIQTERGFIRFLTILRVLFRQRVELEGVVTPEESSTLFCNVDDVLAMNAQLCERLLSAKQQSPTPRIERVGPMLRECFEALDPHVYAVFCANQRRAVALFQQKMKSSPEFARVLDRVHSNPHCARLKFPDFVAKVFQRLSKYPLLLSGIEKYAPKGSSFKSERHDVHAAILRSKHILEEMDWERVLDLQHNLDFSACTSELKHLRRLDLTAHPRQIMREGSLDIVIDSQNNVKEVYVIVLTDLILFTQRRDGHFLLKCPGRNITNEGAKSPVLRLRDAHARAEAAAKDGFLLLNKTDACIYQLRAMSKKKEWIETIT
ncbi:hypothetical protein PTSG_05878 [Salpingoeca rosetta]|uniref:DH domain-containing protein n=1 Tax=Salpingoeca rosetta (strain ATCC 50818 / BSB-021) TaxID=946362 RepID=F2UD19_SALR5|nr:uncharacterized protein PTSG_05878 [Salpingoeca rosetta]EGD74514.1 hypothetical protein PTSG_05878 [Salpingoeca rosetta]|eukprot:XP_004992771.1 hypothetical protein PTSG_05878 [Salpingoeca rosetta]